MPARKSDHALDPVPRTRAEIARHLITRLRRHKTYLLTVPQTVAVIRRLIKHAVPGPEGCIYWGGALNNKHYGTLNVRIYGHRKLYVHQLAELLANDPSEIPDWMDVAHSCDHPPCFNPDHVGRQRRRDNRARSAERTNAKKRGEIPRAGEWRRAA